MKLIFQKQEHSEEQSQQHSLLRGWLLTMLMSGQVSLRTEHACEQVAHQQAQKGVLYKMKGGGK